jgi:hypothetical protein
MPTDHSLQALREAAPRSQPGFEEWTGRLSVLEQRICARPAPTRRLTTQTRRRLIALSAAAATAGLVAAAVGLIPSAASPQSAYAAARGALAATAAATSGTMTVTIAHDGSGYTLDTTRWRGHDIELSSGPRHILGTDRQLLLTRFGVYVQQADGRWLHYSSASDAGPKLGSAVRLAEDNVTGSTARQILALATGIQRTKLPHGAILYTGTIPDSNAGPGVTPADDAALRAIASLRGGNEPGAPGGSHGALKLRLTAGRDGRAQQISLTFQQHGSGSPAGNGSYTWSVSYSQLGTTPPITTPATSPLAETRQG